MKFVFVTLIYILCFNLTSVKANLAYITNEKDNTVSVIDIDKKKVVKTVKVGQRPRGIIMSKDGKLVLICASDDDRVEVRDAKTLKLKYHLPSGPDPELFILSPDDDILYIANEDDAMVTVVDMNDKMIIDDIPVYLLTQDLGLQCLHQMIVKFGSPLKLEVLSKSLTLVQKRLPTLLDLRYLVLMKKVFNP